MKKILAIIVLAALTFGANAQKMKGSVEGLKGQTSINVTFNYDGMKYDGDTEAEFLADKTKGESNADEIKANWTNNYRVNTWQPAFVKSFNEETTNLNLVAAEGAKAEYTINVKINDIDPGNFAGPFSNPSKIYAEITIVKTGSTEAIVTIPFDKFPGNPYVMTPVDEVRVKSAFEQIGEALGKILSKKIK